MPVQLLLFLVKGEHHTVDAIARFSLGTLMGEDVAEVSIARGASDFSPDHAMGTIDELNHRPRSDGLEEGGPPATRLKLRITDEQGRITADAGVLPSPLFCVEGAGPRRFSTSLARYSELCGSEALAVFILGKGMD